MSTQPSATMQASWINPFAQSTVNTFHTLLSCSLSRGELKIHDSPQPTYEISGMMSLEGKATGTVVVSLERSVAVSATEHVMGHASGRIDEDVIDVVCELTNMIAGGANNSLEQMEMRIGLPSVVSGKHHVISFPSGVTTIGIPFDTSWGKAMVEAGIKEA